MDTSFNTPLASPTRVKQELPATIAQTNFVEQTRNQIRRILERTDPRLLLILGPCSIHDIASAKDYAKLLKELIEEVRDEFLIVMRTYFEKSRTSLGWKGIVYDPYLDGTNDINTGIRWSRSLLLELAELQVPAATEILDPSIYHYLGDLISWGCIGARTASSQIHRQAVSGFNLPIAFKNNTDGNIAVAVNGALTASKSHTYMGINGDGVTCSTTTHGNKDCHVVLRGGETKGNYDRESMSHAIALLERASLPVRLVIDCSHGNSKRNPAKQADVFENVVGQIISGAPYIRGLILESHLEAGHQIAEIPLSSKLKYGVSITDPCLDWATTAALTRKAYHLIKETKNEESHAQPEALSVYPD